jgi:phage N-6-adenine-methyltransferase
VGYNDFGRERDPSQKRAEKTDFITPKECRDLLLQLGPLKLDAATSAHNAMGAEQFYTKRVSGLVQSWECGGLVWCNWPWSRTDSPIWVDRIVDQGSRIRQNNTGELVTLGPCKTDTAWFRTLLAAADAIYFWKGRMCFIDPDTMQPILAWNKKLKKWEVTPVMVPLQLAYFGRRVERFIEVFEQQGGKGVDLRKLR